MINRAIELLKNTTPAAWVLGSFHQPHCERNPIASRSMSLGRQVLQGELYVSAVLAIIYEVHGENLRARGIRRPSCKVLGGGSEIDLESSVGGQPGNRRNAVQHLRRLHP